MKFRKIEKLLPWLIVALAFFLRFFRGEALFPFTMDEEYQALLVKQILEKRHLPLIGVNVADTGLYLGPFFTYFSVIPYFLFGSSPIGGVLLAALLGAVTTFVLFKLGEVLDKPVGLLASFLYAVSFLANAYDRKFWNPSLVPLLSALLLLSLIKVRKKSYWWLIIFGILGLSFHVHYSLLGLLPITVYFIFKSKIKLKGYWPKLGLLTFLLITSPLLLFDLRHDFLQTKAFLNLLKPGSLKNVFEMTQFQEKFIQLIKTSSRLVLVSGKHDLAKEINLCSNLEKTTPFLGFSLLLPLSFVFLWKQKLNREKRRILQFLIGGVLSFITVFLFSPFSPAEYYLLPFFPLSYLIFAWAFEKTMKQSSLIFQVLGSGALLGLVLHNTSAVMNMKNSFGLEKKREVINWAATVINDSSYSLESIGRCHRFEGYHYLFTVFFKSPEKSFMDPYFSWLYPEPQFKPMSPEKEIILFNDSEEISAKERDEWQMALARVSSQKILADFDNIKVLILQK